MTHSVNMCKDIPSPGSGNLFTRIFSGEPHIVPDCLFKCYWLIQMAQPKKLKNPNLCIYYYITYYKYLL